MDGQLEALAPQLGLTLTATERERLLAYLALIQRWTKVYNLTAVRDPLDVFFAGDDVADFVLAVGVTKADA